jgi:hypothetical protein
MTSAFDGLFDVGRAKSSAVILSTTDESRFMIGRTTQRFILLPRRRVIFHAELAKQAR